MAFLTEDPPAPGARLQEAPGIARIVAPNPGPMTYHGTNTWLVDAPGGLTIIDPGPDDAAHVAAVAAAGKVARILLTHTHPDHVGGAAALRAATGAPVLGWAKPWLKSFTPDQAIEDGQEIAGLTVLHTPGHASDHCCFARADGVVFTGDHVMSWNTSIVSPPDGDMAAYMDGLRRMLARNDTLYLCGHGPRLKEPQSLVRAMLVHRQAREAAVLGTLGPRPVSTALIVDALYAGLDAALKKAAERTVLAHVLKLVAEGKAKMLDDGSVARA